jgi:hypothetical protein
MRDTKGQFKGRGIFFGFHGNDSLPRCTDPFGEFGLR